MWKRTRPSSCSGLVAVFVVMDGCVVFLDQRMTPTTLEDTYSIEERTAQDPFGVLWPVDTVGSSFKEGPC